MPLPGNGEAWPPKAMGLILPKMHQWASWYANDTQALTSIYQREGSRNPTGRHANGLLGIVKRWFWGSPAGDTSRPQTKLHVPIASDICQASADLLFAEPPTITVDDEATQERLDLITGDGMHDELAAAAELAAALGGVYLRVTWDRGIEDHPFFSRVDADHALPEFQWGRLTAVTFWRVVGSSGGTTWRHLERHETNSLGIGVIQHGLYEGTSENLGRAVPLTENPATVSLAPLVDADGVISTLTPGLDVAFIPNQTPNRRWREHPIGAHLGRSDLDGIEPLMDSFDETWSSWMRDIRLGKARIVAAQSALDDNGPGAGATLDIDREVYEAINTPPSSAAGADKLPLESIQFKIRVEEHQATCEALLGQILRTAGYSAQTFGADSQGGEMTATEVHSRERRSFLTRDRKIRPWKPALERLARKGLAIDRAVFNSTVKLDADVTVQFGDNVQESPNVLATTAQALFQAQAASMRTRVQMQHPDWDESKVDDEVAAIRQEFGQPVTDPDSIGVNGAGLSNAFGSDDTQE